ncbi:unnamed protein product [Cladocopium goreaui]|uniref:Methyltransferase domain-containing protein n=1 Tax=Cladocopium goreaui TaxID=2562237 RepID=A0A9P1G7L9_9DINO|nr:unnamed protein product [Cladocopium goreaui]
MLSVGESVERGLSTTVAERSEKFSKGGLPPYGDEDLSVLYWDARHARSGAAFFDWYLDYSRLRSVFHQEFPAAETQPEILDVGFGTSEIPMRLFSDGWEFVTAVDLSAGSVRLAQQRREQKSLQFLQMDACKLNFPDHCFHAVFDKATFDTLVCSSRPNVSAQAYLSEVFRVLMPGGVFLMVTHSGPAERMPYLLQDPSRGWKVQAARIPKQSSLDGAEAEGETEEGEELQEAAATKSRAPCYWLFLCTKPTESLESH